MAIRKFLDKLSQRSQMTWERIFLTFIILSIAAYSTLTILKSTFVQNSSKFVYPISILFLGIIIFSISKFYQLYIKKDHNFKNLRSGMNLILILGTLNILIGGFGYVFEIFVSSGSGEMFVPFLIIIIRVS